MISWVFFFFFITWKIWGLILSTAFLLLGVGSAPFHPPPSPSNKLGRPSGLSIPQFLPPASGLGVAHPQPTLSRKESEPRDVRVLTKEPFRESRRLEFEIGHYARKTTKKNGSFPLQTNTFAYDFDFLNTQKSPSQSTLALMLLFKSLITTSCVPHKQTT